MKRIILFATVLLLTLAMLGTQALAGIAYPGVIAVYDRDGSRINAINHGDERFSYLTDPNGDLIMRDNSGRYRYVVLSGGSYALGERTASKARLRSAVGGRVNAAGEGDELVKRLDALYQKLGQSMPTLRGTSSISVITSSYDYANDPLAGKLSTFDTADVDMPAARGECPLLVLKVQFADIRCQFDDSAWHDRVFVNGLPDYFAKQSNGAFTYKPVSESWDTPNDGVVCVSLPIDMPTYEIPNGVNQNSVEGAHAGLYTDGTNNYAIFNDSSLYAYGLAEAADHVDFAQYDSNGDGYISPTELSVLVVMAGYEASLIGAQADMPMVWAHYWTNNNSMRGVPPQGDVSSLAISLDGVKLYAYSMIGENWNSLYSYSSPQPSQPAVQPQIGVMCHELGHGLGLRDLYNTSGTPTSKNVRSLSLMAAGNWASAQGEQPGSSPTNLDPYSKTFLEFYDSTTVSQTGVYPVYAASDPARYNILRVNTDDPKVYYLIENRTFMGYDRGLDYYFSHLRPGGVVYWRINERLIQSRWEDNLLNTTEGNYAIMPDYIPSAPGRYMTPFRSSLSYPFEELFTARRAPQTTLSVYDVAASGMNVHINVKDSVPPLTGDSTQPVLWIALAAASAGLIAWLLFRLRRRKH